MRRNQIFLKLNINSILEKHNRRNILSKELMIQLIEFQASMDSLDLKNSFNTIIKLTLLTLK
jgi:hypothetical protein